MRSFNEKLMEADIEHIVELLRYAVSVKNKLSANYYSDIEKMLKDLFSIEIKNKKEMGELLEEADKRIDKAMATFEDNYNAEMLAVANLEKSFAHKLLYSALPKVLRTELILKKYSSKDILALKILNSSTSKNIFNELNTSSKRTFRKFISEGFDSGESNYTIYEKLEKKVGFRLAFDRNAMSVVRTGVMAMANEAKSQFAKDNERFFEGIQWISTLDSKTTPICMKNDGKFFKVGEGPRPPAHYNCRSTIIFVVKKLSDLEKEFDKKVNVDDDTRMSMDGKVSAATNYESFLRGKGDDFITEKLGVVRAKLFKDGKLSLDELVNSRTNNFYTIDTLSEKYDSLFKKLGLT